MGKAYENLVLEREVSLAIENLFIAPYPTSWSPTRVDDVFSPPSGFTWLGAVVEDTPQVTISREKFQLNTGVPRIIQYEAVTSVAGRFECSLYSHSPRKVQYALGNVLPHNIITDASSVTAISSTESLSAYCITLAASPVTDWAVGNYVVTTTTNDSTIAISQNEAQISSINGATVYFGTPGFPTAPTDSDTSAKVLGVKSPFGTALIKTYTLIGVANFIDDVQVVHYVDKCAPGAEFTEAVRPDDVGKVPLAFDFYGVSNADYGSGQLITGQRFWFPPA